MPTSRGNKLQLTKYDVEFMTDTWEGPKGAAWNCVYEDLREAGYITYNGDVTEVGRQALEEYERELVDVSDPDQLSLGL
jgi:hypothetical protein